MKYFSRAYQRGPFLGIDPSGLPTLLILLAMLLGMTGLLVNFERPGRVTVVLLAGVALVIASRIGNFVVDTLVGDGAKDDPLIDGWIGTLRDPGRDRSVPRPPSLDLVDIGANHPGDEADNAESGVDGYACYAAIVLAFLALASLEASPIFSFVLDALALLAAISCLDQAPSRRKLRRATSWSIASGSIVSMVAAATLLAGR